MIRKINLRLIRCKNNNDKTDKTGEEKKKKEDDTASYDYLLSMRIDSLTEEILKELEKERDMLMDQFTGLKNKTAQQLWMDDLVDFEGLYRECLTAWYKRTKIDEPGYTTKLVKKTISYKKNPTPPPKKVLITKKSI